MEFFQNYHLFSFDLLDISELCPYEYVRYFFQCNFLHFRAFLLVYITILERDYMKFVFISSMHQRTFYVFRIILWYGHHAILPLKNSIS